MSDLQPIRAELLNEARDLTCGNRQAIYGDPVETMRQIVALFNMRTGHKLSASDGARFMECLKMVRSDRNPLHRDSPIDQMAYVGIRYECALAEVGPQGERA